MAKRKSSESAKAAVTVAQVVAYFAAQKKRGKSVLTFVGFSGAGYERPDLLRRKVGRILDQHDPKSTIVNIGVTPDGIGAAYGWAKKRGFDTTGIVSTQARKYDTPVSPHCDRAFFVEDEKWGGLKEDGTLSPTSEAMVSVSDEMVAFGGGAIGCDEVAEMRKRGKPVRYRPADMNHAKAIEKAVASGRPAPTASDLRGPIGALFGKS